MQDIRVGTVFSGVYDNLYSPYNGSKGTLKKQTNERK